MARREPIASTTAVEQAGDSLQSEDLIFDLAERRCEDYVTREMKKQAMPMGHCILALSREAATDTLRNLLRQRIFVIDALNVLVEHLEKAANSQLQIYRAQPSHVLDPPFGETAEQQAQSMVKRGIRIAITLLMSRLAPLVGEHIDNYDWVKKVGDEEAERMGQLVSEKFDRLRLEYQARAELIDADRKTPGTAEKQDGGTDDVASKALVRKLERIVGALAEGEKEAKAPAEANGGRVKLTVADMMMAIFWTEKDNCIDWSDSGFVESIRDKYGRDVSRTAVKKTPAWKAIMLQREDRKRDKEPKGLEIDGTRRPDRTHEPKHRSEYEG